MASMGNVVVQTCRFFTRHPARILFILLLVLLILLSRILHAPRMENSAYPRLTNRRQSQDATAGAVEVSFNLQEAAPVAETQADEDSYNVLMTLVKVGTTSPLARTFRRCVNSVCTHATVALAFHVVTDEIGRLTTQDVFRSAAETCKHNFSVEYYSTETIDSKVGSYTKHLQELFSTKQSYYSQPVFFMSIAAHTFLPRTVSRIIMLDSDLEFRSDIAELFHHFASFDTSNIFGLAQEQQPVYRHIFHMYRKEHPNTRIGAPPPDGLTGFNSGVLLIALDRMRNSQLYHQILTGNAVRELTQQYQFQGHLGDQDFYTLIGVKHEELFYTLPCSWNRQLCTWWRDNGYSDIFQLYHNCSEPIHVYHGNCRTEIPEE